MLVLLCRYGGLSFGQENTLVPDNETQLRDVLDRVASALKFDPQLLKNMTIGNVVEDISDVFRRLVTRKNVKVSLLQLI